MADQTPENLDQQNKAKTQDETSDNKTDDKDKEVSIEKQKQNHLKNFHEQLDKCAAEVAGKVGGYKIGNLPSRARASAEFTDARFRKFFDDILEEFKNIYINTGSSQEGLDTLKEAKEKMLERAEKTKKIMIGYVDQMAAIGVKFTPEVLAEIEATSDQMMAILNNPDSELNNVLQWALGLGVENMENAQYTDKAIQILTSNIENRIQNKNNMPLIWMIFRIMKPNERIEFFEKYAKTHQGKKGELMEIMKEANQNGALRRLEVEAILKNANLPPLDEEDQKKLAYFDKVTTDEIEKTARMMAHESEGARNAAGRMLSIGNLLTFLVKTAAVATIAGNGLANAYKNGNFVGTKTWINNLIGNEPNPYFIGAGAGLAGLHIYEERGRDPLYTADKSTRETYYQRQDNYNIMKITNNYPKLENAFKNAEFLHDFAKFAQAKTEKDKGVPRFIDKNSFTEYLKENKKESTLKRFQEFSKEIDEAEFWQLTSCFSRRKISGASPEETEKKYKAAIEFAQNLNPQTATKAEAADTPTQTGSDNAT